MGTRAETLMSIRVSLLFVSVLLFLVIAAEAGGSGGGSDDSKKETSSSTTKKESSNKKCKDWDETRKGMKLAGLEGYAACGGEAGTKKCWNEWCEANCEDAAGGIHPACALDETADGAITADTRCKCDVDKLIEWFEDEAPPAVEDVQDDWLEGAAAKKYNNVCQHLVNSKPASCTAAADCGANNDCWACGAGGKAWIDGKQYECNKAKAANTASGSKPLCKDWDETEQGLKKLGKKGFAVCNGKPGTKECWNEWCEINCEACGGAAGCGGGTLHEACALRKSDVNGKTRCKCDSKEFDKN